jgi:L-Ala-D/L-Glu epimerase
MASIHVTVTLGNGCRGTGEIPTSFAFKDETLPVIRRVLTSAKKRLVGSSIDEWAEFSASFRMLRKDAIMTASGIEVALFRAWLEEHGQSERTYWGNARGRLETDITIPYVPDGKAIQRWLRGAVDKGFTIYKAKIGGIPERDCEFLSFICSILDGVVPGFRLRLDGNQCYSADRFRGFLELIESNSFPVDLIEQPLAKDDFAGYREIRKWSPIPIILDESVSSYQDAIRVIDDDLCDGINIKVAKTGLNESRRILELSQRAQKKLMIGCMIETMVGLSAAIWLASGTSAFDFVDLDSVHFLYGSNGSGGINVSGPVISVTA